MYAAYAGYAGKTRTDSNLAWHRPQSATSRVEEELMQKSARALETATDPLEKLRLMCLSRGASGIMALGRIFRRMEKDGSKHLNKEEFLGAIKNTGVDYSEEDADKLFATFDPENTGSINVDEFLSQIHPPMSEGRRALVEKAFNKLDKTGAGTFAIEDLRRVYKVTASPSYMIGDDSEELTMTKFLAHFETEGTMDGQVTMEEFMAYYSGISVSIEDDGFFDLMMRQSFKL